MAKLNRTQIQDEARSILAANPGGVSWAEVLNAIGAARPETPANSVRGATHVLFQSADDVVKIARGTYQFARFAETDAAETVAQDEAAAAAPVAIDADASGTASASEQAFYASFAEWLKENDEVTIAGAVGGSVLGGKWGTPDVIGVLKPRAQDIFEFEPQIVTAEIKATP